MPSREMEAVKTGCGSQLRDTVKAAGYERRKDIDTKGGYGKIRLVGLPLTSPVVTPGWAVAVLDAGSTLMPFIWPMSTTRPPSARQAPA